MNTPRTVLVLIASVLAGPAGGGPPFASGALLKGEIAVRPQTVWLEESERGEQPDSLRPWAFYRVQEDRAVPIPIRYEGSIAQGFLSPDGRMFAFVGVRADRSGLDSSRYEVVVVDSSGRQLTRFPTAVRAAWSRSSNDLAVAFGCPPWVIPAFDSLAIWQPGRGVTSSLRVSASRGLIGWAGSDTILVGASVMGPAVAVSRSTGRIVPSPHGGTDVSPDGSFSLDPDGYPNPTGLGLKVWDDKSRRDLARPVLDLFKVRHSGGVGSYGWVQYRGRPQALAVTVLGPWHGSKRSRRYRECRTGLVDVVNVKLLGWTRGRLLGIANGSGEPVVVRGSRVLFVRYEDWTAAPIPADTTSEDPVEPYPEVFIK